MNRVIRLLTLTMTRRRFGRLLASGGLLLTGCGGGGGDSGSGGSETPMATPTITAQPAAVSVAEGDAVLLQVSASGEGLSYQWLRNGVVIPGATASRFELTMQAGDDGARYWVRVSNAAGSAESVPVTLTLSAGAGSGGTGELALLAGGLGGAGLLDGRGEAARIRNVQTLIAGGDGLAYLVTLEGDLLSLSADGDLRRIATGAGAELVRDRRGRFYSRRDDDVIIRLDPATSQDWVAVYTLSHDTSLPSDPFLHAEMRTLALDADDRLHFVLSYRVFPLEALIVMALADGGAATEVMRIPWRDANWVSWPEAAPGSEFSTYGFDPQLAFLPTGKVQVLSHDLVLVADIESGAVESRIRLEAGGASGLQAATRVDDSTICAALGAAVLRFDLAGHGSALAGSEIEHGYVEGQGDAARFAPVGDFEFASIEAGRVLVADNGNAVVRRIAIDTRQTTRVAGRPAQAGRANGTGADARFSDMRASCVDALGNLYVIDVVASSLRQVTPAGVVTTRFSDFPVDGGVAVDGAGNFYGVRSGAIVRVAPTGGQVVLAGVPGQFGDADGVGAQARFGWVLDLVVAPDGSLLALDTPVVFRDLILPQRVTRSYGNTVRRVTADGAVSTLAGVSTPVGTGSDLVLLTGLALGPDGKLFVAESTFAVTETGADAEYRRTETGTGGLIRKFGTGSAPAELARWQTDLPDPFQSFGLVAREGDEVIFASGGAPNERSGARGNVVRRFMAAGAVEIVVGHATSYGVRLGALPASLNEIQSLALAPDGALLVCSENSVLRVSQL